MKRKLIYALVVMCLVTIFSGCNSIGIYTNPDIKYENEEDKIVLEEVTKDYINVDFKDELIAVKMLLGEESRSDLEEFFTDDYIDTKLDFINLGIPGRTIIVIPRDSSISIKPYYTRINENGEVVVTSSASDMINHSFFASVNEFEFISNLRFYVYKDGKEEFYFDLGESGMDGHLTFSGHNDKILDLTSYMY